MVCRNGMRGILDDQTGKEMTSENNWLSKILTYKNKYIVISRISKSQHLKNEYIYYNCKRKKKTKAAIV